MRYRPNQTTLSFPPFTPAVKWLVGTNVAIFLAMLFVGLASHGAVDWVQVHFALVPSLLIHHGWLWQLVTYAFLHGGVMHVLFNMLALWMFGATLEMDWRAQHFLEFYFFCVIGAALTTVGVSYSGMPHVAPDTMTLGASGGVYGILLAFGMLYGDQEIMLFPLPFLIK